MDSPSEAIIGIHSIMEAMGNPNRIKHKLYATKSGLTELSKKFRGKPPCKVETLGQHAFQEKAKEIYRQHDFEYHRISGGLLLVASPTPLYDAQWVLEKVEEKNRVALVCLDGATDVHNRAAVVRTCGHFGVDALIFCSKRPGRISPGMGRISSGALEYVPLVCVSSLPRLLKKLASRGVEIIGLSQHAPPAKVKKGKEKCCLILGAEDTGLTHAVKRCLPQIVSLQSRGAISSLNVSVAAALGMELFFKKR